MAIPSFSMPAIPDVPKLNVSALASPTIPKLPDIPPVPAIPGVQGGPGGIPPAIPPLPGIPMVPGPGPSLPSSSDMANLDPRKLENIVSQLNVMASAQDAMKIALTNVSGILSQVVSKVNTL